MAELRRSRDRSTTSSALKAVAWLVLVLAILERYVLKLGDTSRDVNLITAGLLLLAITLRILAWRLGTSRAGGPRGPDVG